MSDNASFPSLIQLEFRRAKAICKRNVLVRQDAGNSKSYAQVESFVRQHAVSQNSCGLKPDGARTYRLITRFTQAEHEIVVRQAKAARMTVSAFIRLTLLKSPMLDPDRHRLLLKLHLELTRQGTNLNQIARHLNAGIASPEQADSLLAMLGRSLLAAHQAVREALAQGRSES